MANTLSLQPGQRLRTGSVTYEVIRNADVPADVVPVTPQGTRLLKVTCSDCGYVCRVTQRWVTKAGTPICPCGHGSMVVADAPKASAKAVKTAKPPKPSKASDPMTWDVEKPIEPMVPADIENVEDDGNKPSTLAQLIAELPAD